MAFLNKIKASKHESLSLGIYYLIWDSLLFYPKERERGKKRRKKKRTRINWNKEISSKQVKIEDEEKTKERGILEIEI